MRDFLPAISGYCHRPRLDALFDKAMEYSLVTVMCGPGYGKSLAMASYARAMPGRLIWLRIVDLDNDPNRFWESFQGSLYRELPELRDALAGTQFPLTTGSFASFLRIFADAVYTGPRVVMVVDDCERLADPQAALFLQGILDADLENLTVVLLNNSRRLPFGTPLPNRGFAQITTEDLAFTPQEAQALFAQGGGKPLSLKQAERVVGETGGWALALNALHASGLPAPAPGISHHQLAAALFEQGFYQAYPEPVRRLLVGLSLLPSFPLALARAHAGDALEDMLDALYLNVFVTYDYVEELFTYQRMYREFLARKRALLDDAEVEAIQRDAGAWFLGGGYFHEAMDCFWACRDYDRFMDTLKALPRRRTTMQVSNTVLARLNAIPAGYSETHPYVDFARALFHLSNSDVTLAKDILEQVAARLEAGPQQAEDRLLLGDACVTLGDISILQNRVDGLGYIKKAAALLTEGCRVRTKDLFFVENNSVFYLPGTGPGLVRPTVDFIFEYAAYADKVVNGSGYGLQWLFASEAAFLQGHMDAARQHAYAAIQRGRSMQQHDIVANGYWMLMRVSFYYGDHIQGKAFLDQLSTCIEERETTELYELRDSAHAWYNFMLGDYEQAKSRMADYLLTGYDMPLTLGRNWLLTAHCYAADGTPERALALLDELDAQIADIGHWAEKVSLNLMRAHAFVLMNRTTRAVEAFRRSYGMLWENDLKMPIIEYGKDALPILEAARAAPDGGFNIDWLEAVQQEAVSYAKRSMAMRRAKEGEGGAHSQPAMGLTAREQVVLGYLAQGMTREEIAHMMEITVNGVKKHLAKIYNKLGAVNRADAIHIATIAGLVNDV